MPNPLVDLTDVPSATAFLSENNFAVPSDLDAIITGVSAQMQQFANRNFVSQSYSTVLSGIGGRRLLLPNTPVTAVSSLTIDDEAIPASTGRYVPGYVFDDLGIWLRYYDFCRGPLNIALTYTAGYATVPQDLARACCEGVAAVIAAMATGDPRVVEVKAGGSSFRYASDSKSLADVCLTPNVTRVLMNRLRGAPI